MPILTLPVYLQVGVATSLAMILPTTAVPTATAAWEIQKSVRDLGVGGIIGTLIGAYVANMIPSYILKKLLGVLLLVTAVPMIRRFLNEHKQNKKDNEKVDNKNGTKKHLMDLK
ncbi:MULTISPECIES: TSUP family transporter [Methanobacterium]|uniref:Probable membrane transporter protein n=1 Tax=Methanobacterium veterum TaxID=408577 RepID=A0A9E5DN19_9EURY|nr:MULTISPECIES: TSUP family transporter [Methanobacterium]MCZ3367330.1 TSUP family transporter [Methanobacterium veterum]MCZ3373522.1 TSUP family transporter [Methanobacterium veterum]